LRNSRLALLQAYPFERLRALLSGLDPNPAFAPINLSIGEPKHATPALIKRALTDGMDGLAAYPATAGATRLKTAIAAWLKRRYDLDDNEYGHILPVNGSREALFSFAQALLDPAQPGKVAFPNPFYQIYEGATLLAGAEPLYLNTSAETGFAPNFSQVGERDWSQVRMVYVCSPGNPCGNVMGLGDWRVLFNLSDRFGFTIASDECYSEIYFDEAAPPLGGLQAAKLLGRNSCERLVTFTSLSKRSNAPGLRSGFVAGDPSILRDFLLYRTYHGSAMSLMIQNASAAAWEDENHVVANRREYASKFRATLPLVPDSLHTATPGGGFYYWMQTPVDDTFFARELWRQYNVLVLPGSFLAREARGLNPGKQYVRIALVAPLTECVEAMERLSKFANNL
jgi:N-succinyldiaminopimelate aminotransferase